MLTKDPRGVFHSPQLEQLDWLDHGFGGRHAGNWVSHEPFATLSQIHSADVFEVSGTAGQLGRGDALVTRDSAIWLTIRTADCVPVIFADPVRRVVGIAHAGWRGTVAGVVEKTVEKLCVRFSTSVSDLLVSLGPSINECCFEVGPEVAVEFRKWFPERDDLDRKTMLDLETALFRQLTSLGVDPARIELPGSCTKCTPAEFESYRRDGQQSGRMVSAVRIRPSK